MAGARRTERHSAFSRAQRGTSVCCLAAPLPRYRSPIHGNHTTELVASVDRGDGGFVNNTSRLRGPGHCCGKHRAGAPSARKTFRNARHLPLFLCATSHVLYENEEAPFAPYAPSTCRALCCLFYKHGSNSCGSFPRGKNGESAAHRRK